MARARRLRFDGHTDRREKSMALENNVFFLLMLFFAALLGFVIFTVSRRDGSSLGQAIGLLIVAAVAALGFYVLY